MSALAERLDRLRRQAGQAATMTAVGAASAAMPMARHSAPLEFSGQEASGLKPLPQEHFPPKPIPQVPESIRRMLGIRTRASAPAFPPRPIDGELPGVEIAPGLRYRELHFDGVVAPAMLDASFAKNFATVGRRDVLAFDTETTGLAGGTGTRAFMIGVADWVEVDGVGGDRREGFAASAAPTCVLADSPVGFAASAAPTRAAEAASASLRVRQLFLTQMRGEDAMLEAFAAWLAPSTVLVSYNGRCYDAPLLDTRYRLARRCSPLAGLAHLDLLFPSRRRWRGRWENCRLATIEREVLGVVREDDLPGSEAPRAWLDYLRRGEARDFRRVLAHNDQDVRSLARLLVRLGDPG